MAAATVNVTTIYDEVKAAMNFNADNTDIRSSAAATTYMTEATVNRITYAHIVSSQSEYNAELMGEDGAGTQVYAYSSPRWYYWLLPSITGEIASPTGNVYELYSSGSIEVTTGTDSRDEITVTASVVNFALVMKDVFMYVASNYSRQIAKNFANSSITPSTVRSELMEQANHWTVEDFLQN